MAAEGLVGDEGEVDHLASPGHVLLDQPIHEPLHTAGERLRPGNADVEITRVFAMPSGARAEEKNLVAGVGHRIEADPPGLGEVFLLEGRPRRRLMCVGGHEADYRPRQTPHAQPCRKSNVAVIYTPVHIA